MTEESAPRRDPRVTLLLWMLPLWLVISSGVGMWLYFRKQAAAAQEERLKIATVVSKEGLQDDMSKLLGFVGERHTASEVGAQGLNRAAAMIEGSLGGANAGYTVERVRTPETGVGTWPILVATLRGQDAKLDPLWVVAAYDTRPGSPGAEANASGVASVMAAAHQLADKSPKRAVSFAFLPHAYDADAPLMETFEALRGRIGGASEVLVVESTGAAKQLMLSSRNAESGALRQVSGIGEVVGAESICLEEDFDLSSVLFETGLPTVRVATRPVVKMDEEDAGAPDPAIHAGSTGALVTLIQRLSDS
ncbi:M28 family peptidase [Luteolibacter luteus]|uniref:M28 family peptidase n=1 Tax=Luteolibacter luteus TaxID=2728835 RepID=A0A858RDI8_9BACT|nr:M28 family peptidase [Luteolibacter luteus]QJE94654.1 M28 family peptidase [Luteolibacter luteus]